MKLASEVDIGFPYGGRRVCWIAVENGVPCQLHTKDAKRQAVRRARADEINLYAVWPGQWQSDLFRLDDLDAAAASLGMASIGAS